MSLVTFNMLICKAVDNFSRLGVLDLKGSKFIADHAIKYVNYLGVV